MTREELDEQEVLRKKWEAQEAAKRPKFCVNCRWCNKLNKHFCLHERVIVSLVTGQRGVAYCTDARTVNFMCGPDAKLFEEEV